MELIYFLIAVGIGVFIVGTYNLIKYRDILFKKKN